MNNYLTGAALDKEIASIATKGAKLDASVQAAGLGAINHLILHRDTGPVNRLFKAMAQGHRKSALTQWLLTYARVEANTSKETKAEQPFVFSREKFAADVDATAALEQAAQTPWYKFKPEPTPDQVPDVLAMVVRILSKVDKVGEVREEDVGLVAELRNLVKRDEAVTAIDDAGSASDDDA